MNVFSCCVVFVVLVMSGNLAAQTVVVNDNIEFVPDLEHFDVLGTNYKGIVFQDTAGDYTDVLFAYDELFLAAIAPALDEGSDWYLVNPGDAFGFATLESSQFTPLLTPIWTGNDDVSQPVFVGFDDFYLGVSTLGEGLITPNFDRNVFGWVRLRTNWDITPTGNVTYQLEMVENAVAYDSLGIIVGTTDLVIPEPSALTLAALGLLVMCWRRRRP